MDNIGQILKHQFYLYFTIHVIHGQDGNQKNISYSNLASVFLDIKDVTYLTGMNKINSGADIYKTDNTSCIGGDLEV